MIRGSTCILAVASAIGLALATPAQAELTLCNRTSYRLDAAIGLEKRANVATRGWFRIDPGACRQIVDGPLDVDMVYVHGRTPPVYGSAPLPQANHAELCIRDGDFEIANARGCPLNQQARFTAAQPSDSRKGRPSILRKKPTTTTRRRGLPASNACWRSPATTPTRSTALRAPGHKPR